MASLCDKCFAPGQCCKRITFHSGNEVTYWLDIPLAAQLPSRFHEDDKDRLNPFRAIEVRSINTDADSKRPYGYVTFNCVNLTKDGRCGDYENRPWLCRVFEPGEGPLCVHWRGAEGHVE